MRKILEKWYVSLFILPIVLTYLTNYFDLPIIFSNKEYSIIISLCIIIGILIYEIIVLNKRIKSFEEKPKKGDKKIINELLEILDIDKFHEEIVLQNAWYGYHRDDIHRIIEFQEKSKLIGYKTSNQTLNNLINNFVSALDEFTDYSSVRVYGKGDWLIPFKDNIDKDERKKIKQETDKMNDMTKKCFFELENLMKYLKEKNYL